MTTNSELPRQVLEKALNLRNAVREIYLGLYNAGKPQTADELAVMVNHARAYVNMRLNQLEDLGLVKHLHVGKIKYYDVCERY